MNRYLVCLIFLNVAVTCCLKKKVCLLFDIKCKNIKSDWLIVNAAAKLTKTFVFFKSYPKTRPSLRVSACQLHRHFI